MRKTSGLELGDEPNTFWSHNDKNNPTEVYQFDNTGLLLKTITIANGLTQQQSDYEDLAKDDNSNLYIADVGDNQLNKVTYRIYKINTDSTELTEVPTIKFFYPNFERINCESIFWWDGFIYLFIKNPYEAEFIENFNNPGSYPFSITGADISPNGETLILMSKDEFYLLKCFTAPYFFSASAVIKVPFERVYQSDRIPQTEGIVFADDETIFIVDEQTDPDEGPPLEFGNLYTYTLTDIYTDNSINCANTYFDCGLITNYSFSNEDNGWTIINTNGVSSDSNVEGQKLNTTFFFGGIDRAHIRIQQVDLQLQKDNIYVLQFEAEAYSLSSVTLDNICIKPIECQKFEKVESETKLTSFKSEDYIIADNRLNDAHPVTYIAADSICLLQNFDALIRNCE